MQDIECSHNDRRNYSIDLSKPSQILIINTKLLQAISLRSTHLVHSVSGCQTGDNTFQTTILSSLNSPPVCLMVLAPHSSACCQEEGARTKLSTGAPYLQHLLHHTQSASVIHFATFNMI